MTPIFTIQFVLDSCHSQFFLRKKQLNHLGGTLFKNRTFANYKTDL